MTAAESKLTEFKKDTWYTIMLVMDKLIVDGKQVEQKDKVIQFHVRYDEDSYIDYKTLFLKTIRYPTSFWKMFKLWRQNKRCDLCR